jgi:Zn-finger nucleic acid-binding protein
MKCPTDDTTLVMSERSGIEIDYCPTCRGVWLDRGELDKIVERSLDAPATSQSVGGQAPIGMPYPQRSGHHSGAGYDQYGRKQKRGGWLGELFD